jgi:hypothetical protein
MASGSYLEFHSPTDCKLYGPKGELIKKVTPIGEVPSLRAGRNSITFECAGPSEHSARAQVTVISHGDPL